MLKVLIVDDHPIVRQGLKQILEETSDIKAAGEASNWKETLKLIGENSYDLVLLDISMPGISGMEILKQIKSLRPKLPVLILSMYTEEQYGARVLRAGASGYLTKQSAPDELVLAIRRVCQGGKYVSPNLADRLIEYLGEDPTKPANEVLSDREYEVMLAIASGKTISKIADDMLLSIKTVSTYHGRILSKLQMKSDAELIRYALENQLVPSEEFTANERTPKQKALVKADSGETWLKLGALRLTIVGRKRFIIVAATILIIVGVIIGMTLAGVFEPHT
jgi:DNA-binding NarL/FixJ family response regulator